MTLFSYRAINEDGKEVRGTIDSADADAARKAVEDLHLEVIDLSEASRNKPSSPTGAATTATATTFAFEGNDADGTTRRGTIQASSKRDAFDRLRNDQKLTLLMLAPMGTLPKYNDPDLASWQAQKKTAVQIPVQPVKAILPVQPSQPVVPKTKPQIAFTPVPATVNPPIPAAKTEQKNAAQPPQQYHSISTTLRLYAAWLLAWYGLFVSVGYYASFRVLPWDIPFVQAFFVSPLIFSFTVAIFLFLLFSQIHKAINGHLISGTLLTIAGAASFVIFRASL